MSLLAAALVAYFSLGLVGIACVQCVLACGGGGRFAEHVASWGKTHVSLAAFSVPKAYVSGLECEGEWSRHSQVLFFFFSDA